MSPQKHLEIAGSAQTPLPDARNVARLHPREPLAATIYLRTDPAAPPAPEPEELRALEVQERVAIAAAARGDVDRVVAFAEAHELRVVEADGVKRRVRVLGHTERIERAFAVELAHYEHPEGWYRSHLGPACVPADLLPLVEAVGGLDTRPVARPCLRPLADAHHKASTFTVRQLAEIYDFPTGYDGTGQTVGIIELAGGFRSSDLQTYFSSMGLESPEISTFGPNQPGPKQMADVEVALDIEIVGALVPKAKIAVYFGANTQQGFLDTVQDALTDTHNAPSVLSISWGGPETNWSQAMADHMRSIIRGAAGVSVFAASGDSGAAAGLKNQISPLFPAAVPEVTACGGTSLFASGATWQNETAWTGSGGGISCRFPRPAYQETLELPAPAAGSLCPAATGRGVPDVAANADPYTGYLVFVHGAWATHGGTSAAAPLWAALATRINQANGFAWGPLNPALYRKGKFHDITAGSNGAYSASAGWDPVTGLGSPIGSEIRRALKKNASAPATETPRSKT